MEAFFEDVGAVASSVIANVGGGFIASSSSALRVAQSDFREGGRGELPLTPGNSVRVTILAVDAVSEPCRAKVRREDTSEVLTVSVHILDDDGVTCGDETALLDGRTTTIFQDFEDSFDLVRDYWKKPLDANVASNIPECQEDNVLIADEHKELPGDAKIVEDNISKVAWEKIGLESSLPPMDGLVTRMASLDSLKDLWHNPFLASEDLKHEGKAVSGAWEKLRFPDSFSKIDRLISRLASVDNLPEGVKETTNSPDTAAKVAVEPEPIFESPGVTAWKRLGLSNRIASGASFFGGSVFGGQGAADGATFERAARPPPEDEPCQRVRRALVTLPIEMSFELPLDFVCGQESIFIQGPHGPVQAPVPFGAVPGQIVNFRLGPSNTFCARVPQGLTSGDTLSMALPDGRCIQVQIPDGKCPGDEFDVSPPVLMVQVPHGAQPGDQVAFTAPSGGEHVVMVPHGLAVGSYFAVPLDESPMPTESAGSIEHTDDLTTDSQRQAFEVFGQ